MPNAEGKFRLSILVPRLPWVKDKPKAQPAEAKKVAVLKPLDCGCPERREDCGCE